MPKVIVNIKIDAWKTILIVLSEVIVHTMTLLTKLDNTLKY